MTKISLIVGDWGMDGHGMSESFVYESNLTQKLVSKAYEDGTLIVGFNLTEDVASLYEESNIETEKLNKLKSLGFSEQLSYESDGKDGVHPISVEDYVDMWLFIVKLGNPKFVATEVENEKINIGGYGLFYN